MDKDPYAKVGALKISVRSWGHQDPCIVEVAAPTWRIRFATKLMQRGWPRVLRDITTIQRRRRAEGICDGILSVERTHAHPDRTSPIPRVHACAGDRTPADSLPVAVIGRTLVWRKDAVAYDFETRTLLFVVDRSNALDEKGNLRAYAVAAFKEHSGCVFPILNLLANAAFSNVWPGAPAHPLFGPMHAHADDSQIRCRYDLPRAKLREDAAVSVTLDDLVPGVSFRTVGYHVGEDCAPFPRDKIVHETEQRRRDRHRAQAATWLATGKSTAGTLDTRHGTEAGGGTLQRIPGRMLRLKAQGTVNMRRISLALDMVDGSDVWRAFVAAHISVIDDVSTWSAERFADM